MESGRDGQAYLQAYPHIGETGFLFRRHLPAQEGGIQLQDGRSWIAFWRENRNLPGRHCKASASRQKPWNDWRTETNRAEPNATITQAADLRKAGLTWPESSRAFLPMLR